MKRILILLLKLMVLSKEMSHSVPIPVETTKSEVLYFLPLNHL